MFHCTVAEAQERCSAAEYHYWIAHYRRHPFGDDWRQAATVAYWAGNSGRMKKSTKVADLIPAAKRKGFVSDPKAMEHLLRLTAGRKR